MNLYQQSIDLLEHRMEVFDRMSVVRMEVTKAQHRMLRDGLTPKELKKWKDLYEAYSSELQSLEELLEHLDYKIKLVQKKVDSYVNENQGDSYDG